MKRSTLFETCLKIPYTHVENAADYATQRRGTTLYIYFEASDGLGDWKTNFNFPAKAYPRPEESVWFAHRGFLKVWKTIEPYLVPSISDQTVRKIVTVGYSHGAALALLCHEYIWHHRPDLRAHLEGYGFGCPRVIWGCRRKALRKRWASFEVIRNLDDLVTHVPPALFGFFHVGNLLEIGTRGKYSAIDAHRPENILAELRAYECAQSALQPRFGVTYADAGSFSLKN